MPHHISSRIRCRKSLLAMAACAALLPPGAWALDLAQSPPATVKPYVAPNVIISVDDSGSMSWPVGGTGPRRREQRMTVLQDALRSVFSDYSLLPDSKIRLAWQAMWNNGRSRGANSVNQPSMQENSMRPLERGHRSHFLNFVDRLIPNGGTPSHPMFVQADAYMRRGLDQNSPWASKPGVQGGPYLACRRNYHIFMSDGRWNTWQQSVPTGQGDSASQTLPDGKTYDWTRRPYGDRASGTLADWAFYSWAKPLQTSGLTGRVKTSEDYDKAPPSEMFGTTSLDKYWNPRHNPATWPHMVTYTIGFSLDAITWPGDPSIVAPVNKVPFDYTGSFPDLVNGTRSWPAMGAENVRALDLWHAALNGRGRFYAVEQAEDLEKAFREIIGSISSENKPGISSAATSGSSVSRSDVGQYVAEYDPTKGWSGTIKAYKVKADGTAEAEGAPWDASGTAKKLDDLSNANIANRLVLSWGDTANKGVTFKWVTDESKLSMAQKTALETQHHLNYLRGDTSKQRANVNDTRQPFRWRASRQGDIVNSQVWYTGRPVSNYALPGYAGFTRNNRGRTPMLYVGGNDGMLHGFSAKDGSELIAYVPRGVFGHLKELTNPAYNHRYFVDGSPMTGDVDIANVPSGGSTPDWRTMLMGTLGAGGRGYFVLDVTNPDKDPDGTAIKAPRFAEGNAQHLVVMDRTLLPSESAAADVNDANADLGNITAAPVRDEDNGLRTTQITRLNDNRWAVVMGNGYNSTNQRPVLLIQYLDGAKELLRIPVTSDAPGRGNAADNGLAAPQLVDLNGDGRADVVYAGDNLGNLWKFDLTADTPGVNAYGIASGTGWKVAFGGQPLFTAEHESASAGSGAVTKRQPISAPPILRANDRMKQVGEGQNQKTVPVGGMMVAFGTGRNVSATDPGSTDVQTLYSVLDHTRYKVIDTSLGKRLQVHPGHSCGGATGCTDVPAPTPLGKGVTNAKLAKQKVTGQAAGKGGMAPENSSNELKLSTWKDFNGWYLDFPVAGERLLKPMSFYDGSNVLAVYSQVPQRPQGDVGDATVESCDEVTVNDEKQFRTFVNMMDGKNPSVPLMDGNSDGVINHLDVRFSRTNVSPGSHNILNTGRHSAGDVDDKNRIEKLARFPEQALRPVWRQLQ